MPELDSAGPSLKPAVAGVLPPEQGRVLIPLGMRQGLAAGPSGFAIARTLNTAELSPSDIRAFDAALADGGGDGDQSEVVGPRAADPALAPAAIGSLSEMTAALGVYRDVNGDDRADAAPDCSLTGGRGAETEAHSGPFSDATKTLVPSALTAQGQIAQAPTAQGPTAQGPIAQAPITARTSLQAPETRDPEVGAAMTAATLSPYAALLTKRASALAAAGDASDRAEDVQSPRAILGDPLPVSPVNVAAPLVPAALPAPPSPASASTPAVDRDVAAIVQHVTRILAMRDLDALDAGREVVIRLDENILPETVLTFRSARAAPGLQATGDNAQVLVSVQTRSAEVRAFLDTQGQSLIEAMASEAPGLRWLSGGLAPANRLASATVSEESSATLAQMPTPDPAQGSMLVSASANERAPVVPRDDALVSADNPSDASRQQDQGGSGDSGRGQHQERSPYAEPATDVEADSGANAVARWASLSRAAQAGAASGFLDALGPGN